MIEAICAWCNRSLGTRDWANEGVTHGICQDCKKLELKKKGLEDETDNQNTTAAN
jgi:hypothetical protein